MFEAVLVRPHAAMQHMPVADGKPETGLVWDCASFSTRFSWQSRYIVHQTSDLCTSVVWWTIWIACWTRPSKGGWVGVPWCWSINAYLPSTSSGHPSTTGVFARLGKPPQPSASAAVADKPSIDERLGKIFDAPAAKKIHIELEEVPKQPDGNASSQDIDQYCSVW